MNPHLTASLRPHLDRLRPLLAAARARGFWIRCAVVGAVAVGALGALGRSALARTYTARGEAGRLEQVRSGLERWRREGVLPSPVEVEIWRGSEAALAALDTAAVEPLLVARRVADRAERVGVHGLSIRLAATDSLGSAPPTQVGRWTVDAIDTGLLVEFSSDPSGIIAFLGALPPQVEVGGMEVTGDGEMLRTRLALRLLRAEGAS
jgi:hypothetical protein